MPSYNIEVKRVLDKMTYKMTYDDQQIEFQMSIDQAMGFAAAIVDQVSPEFTIVCVPGRKREAPPSVNSVGYDK
jgi:Rod binding domain-containing protein